MSSSAIVGCGTATLDDFARKLGSLGTLFSGFVGSNRLEFQRTSRARLRERDLVGVEFCAASDPERPRVRSSETERRPGCSTEPSLWCRVLGLEGLEGSLMEGLDLLVCCVVAFSEELLWSFCLILSNIVDVKEVLRKIVWTVMSDIGLLLVLEWWMCYR